MIADSRSTPRDSFDSPCRRSDESDRDLDDAGALVCGHEQHLYEERVAVRDEPVQGEASQHLAPPAAIAARAVAGAQSCDEMNVQISKTAQESPAKRPVDNRAAGNVPGSNDHIGLAGRRDQVGQMPGVVRQVGVHLTDHVDRLADCLLDSVNVGPSEAATSRPVHNIDAAGMLAREILGDTPGTVWRSIVNDQDSHVRLRQKSVDEHREIVALVVGRYDDKRACSRDRLYNFS